MQIKMNAMSFGGRAAVFASLAALGVLGVSGNSLAASASATASASVQNPISIERTADLSFGTFAASSTASTVVTVAPSGGVDGTALNMREGNAAAFTVRGEANESYSITLPEEGVVLTLEDGSDTMNIRDWTVGAGGDGTVEGLTGTLSEAGTGTLQVGATLDVGQSQTGGSYIASFAVEVEYN